MAVTAGSPPPAIPPSEAGPHRSRNLFGSEPGWIAHYEVETTSGKDIGKVAAIVEPWQFTLASQFPAGLPQRTKVTSKILQLCAQRPVESSGLAEEIRAPGLLQAADYLPASLAFENY